MIKDIEDFNNHPVRRWPVKVNGAPLAVVRIDDDLWGYSSRGWLYTPWSCDGALRVYGLSAHKRRLCLAALDKLGAISPEVKQLLKNVTEAQRVAAEIRMMRDDLYRKWSRVFSAPPGTNCDHLLTVMAKRLINDKLAWADEITRKGGRCGQ